MATQLLDHMPASMPASMPSTKSSISARCNVHGKDGCEFVCKTCHVPLCRDCMRTITKGSHVGHDLDDIEDAKVKLRKELHSLERKMKSLNEKFESSMDQLEKEIEKSRDENTAIAVKRADDVIAQAVEWKEQTMQNIIETSNKAEKRLQDEKATLEKIQNDARKIFETTGISLDGLDIISVNENIDALRKTLETFNSRIPSKQGVNIGKITGQGGVEFGILKAESLTFASTLEGK